MHTPGVFADHEVRLEPGSLAARAVGAERVAVRRTTTRGSTARRGPRRRAAGPSRDGVIEAIELPDRRFALGVLWHAEEDERSRVIGGAGRGRPRRVAA